MKTLKNKLNLTLGNFCYKTTAAKNKLKSFYADTKGDGSFNVLITIVVSIVVAGLLILALKAFFPTLWSSLTNKITTTLDL